MATENFILSGPEENYDIPSGVSLGKLIIDKVRARGRDEIINIDAITNDVLTCGELLDNSIKAVILFKTLGLQQGDVISIIGENSSNYCVAVVACLYMGVVANLLNPDYSTGELKHALSISKPKVILCQKTVLQTVEDLLQEFDFVTSTLVIDRDVNELEEERGVGLLDRLLANITINSQSLEEVTFDCRGAGALILMSSGTTGLPKGVLLTHDNFRIPIGVVLDSYFGAAQLNSEVTLTALPMFHVLGITIQILSIIISGKLIVMNKFQPVKYLECIEKNKVTCLPLVPPILLFLTKHPLVKNFNLTSVKRIYCGAAALGKDVQQNAFKVLPNSTVQQVYGITEVTGMCTFTPSERYKLGSSGVLIPRLQAKVWNPETCEIVGPLQIGEFCFKGPMVMKGYVGTASTGDIDEDGFYHTGDIGYYDEDGFIFVTDRIKELIKYKGFQVSPTELENLILTHPAIKECAVIGIPDEAAGQLPMAFVVIQAGAIVSEKEIVQFVGERISVQKHLHGGIRFIDEVPKNSSGKILRRKLMEIYNSA